MTGHTPPTDQQLTELDALANAATPSPWCTDGWEIYQGAEYQVGAAWIGETCRGPVDSWEQDNANAAFTAAARAAVPALVAEVRRLRARQLTPGEYNAAWHAVEGAAGEEGADPGTVLHAVLDRLGIEWQDAADPGTVPAAVAPDTLPAWLYQRFAIIHGCPPWDRITDDDRTYWEHQARAVRRAVARGGFKTTERATVPAAVETGE